MEPVNINEWCTSAGVLDGSIESVILEEIAHAIKAAAIALEVNHAESAPGQYEVVTAPLTPLDAADALIYTREVIVQVAAKHGLHATFAPRPFADSIGSGVHAHISVYSQSEAKVRGCLSSQACSSTCPPSRRSPSPRRRRTSACRTACSARGRTCVCYGTENRETSLRITNVASPASRNLEARFIDGTASPYLALAAVCAGGLVGFRGMMRSEMQGCEERSAAEMTEAERWAHGITKGMPLSIEEARRNLEGDDVLCEVLGPAFVEKYLAVNKTLQGV